MLAVFMTFLPFGFTRNGIEIATSAERKPFVIQIIIMASDSAPANEYFENCFK